MHFDTQVFHSANQDYDYCDDLYGDEYGYEDDDDPYGIENHRYIQKNLTKKTSKVTSK